MVKVILIRNLKDIVPAIKTLNKIQRRLPLMTSDTMMQWGKMLEKSVKDSAQQAGIKRFTGTLYNKGIEWRQRPKGKKGELFIRLHGVYLDSMKPHYVNVLRRRTNLMAWALKANNAKIRFNAQKVQNRTKEKFPIYVTPKPFINRGYRRARRRLKPMLRKAAKVVIQSA